MTSTYEHAIRPTFDPDTETYHISHDAEMSWPITTSIVLSLSSLVDDEPTEMSPLTGAVDPDELQDHVSGRSHGTEMEFEWYGFRVTVRDDGETTFIPMTFIPITDQHASTTGSDVAVDYDPAEDRYRASYDLEEIDPSLAVVKAIAAVEGVDPLDMEPLGTTVDLEALDSVLQSGTGTSDPTITLRIRGYEIILYSSGLLVLQRLDAEPGDAVTSE